MRHLILILKRYRLVHYNHHRNNIPLRPRYVIEVSFYYMEKKGKETKEEEEKKMTQGRETENM